MHMRVNFSIAGNAGWASVGFNSRTRQMLGASIVMGYGTNINEYDSNGNNQPSLITPKITNAIAYRVGSGLTLQFTRPLTSAGYFGITDTLINLMLVYNSVTTPTGPNSWDKHTRTFTQQINLFTPSTCPFQCFGILSIEANVCGGKGTCISANNCTCNAGWSGSQCQTPLFSCFGISPLNSTVCFGNGNCVSQDTCFCNAGWSGSNCSESNTLYCGTFNGHFVEWSILPTNELQMTVNFTTGGSKGWVSVGFNAAFNGMSGSSIIMAYGNNINEYYSPSLITPTLITKRISQESTRIIGNRMSLTFVRPLSVAADPTYFAIPKSSMTLMLVYNDQSTPSSPNSWAQHTSTYSTPINLYTGTICSNSPLPNTSSGLFPFHYIVLAILVIISVLLIVPLVYLLHVFPGFDLFLHLRVLPFLNVKYLTTLINDFNLSLGEMLLIVFYIMMNFAWIFVPAWNMSLQGYHPVNTIGRIFGQLNLLNFTFALLPVTRYSLWVWIFGIPFNRALKYHRWLTGWSYICVCIHFILMAVWNGIRNAPAYPWTVSYTTSFGVSYGIVLFGFISWIFYTLIVLTSFVRIWSWEIFKVAHIVFGMLFIATAAVHHYHFLLHVAVGLILWIIDIIIRFIRLSIPVKLVSIKSVDEITILELETSLFKWSPGQCVFLWVGNVSPLELHPFTISSAPNSGKITLHIKQTNATGVKSLLSFTHKLKQFAEKNDTSNAWVRLEGPYGNPTMRYDDYKVLYLLGGGIGITPLISILGHYSKLISEGKTSRMKEIVFVWSVRSAKYVSWFQDVFETVSKIPNVKLRIHVTNENDAEQSMVPVKKGRPNFVELFDEIEKENKCKYYGVVVSGPAQMVSQIQAICWKRNTYVTKQYHFHHEVFEY